MYVHEEVSLIQPATQPMKLTEAAGSAEESGVGGQVTYSQAPMSQNNSTSLKSTRCGAESYTCNSTRAHRRLRMWRTAGCERHANTRVGWGGCAWASATPRSVRASRFVTPIGPWSTRSLVTRALYSTQLVRMSCWSALGAPCCVYPDTKKVVLKPLTSGARAPNDETAGMVPP